MNLEWARLRTWNGSQNSAFEELCCQLAHAEAVPAGSKFIRKGTPDAGVECFWQLPNGDERAWQAKLFASPPNDGQWVQIDDSVRTALEKHPRLKAYTVCLPIDRADPRIEGRENFMDKWDIHARKWQEWADERKMSVGFEYWGNHEITHRLALDEHRGRHFFWFNEELFSQDWFRARLEESMAMAGARYTPELNVELPIAQVFEGLGRTQGFFDGIAGHLGDIKRRYRACVPRQPMRELQGGLDALEEAIRKVLSLLESAKAGGDGPIAFDSLSREASETVHLLRGLVHDVEELEKVDKEERAKAGATAGVQPRQPDFTYLRGELYKLIQSVDDAGELSESMAARLANLPALLVVGNAGTGKTHLFCDLAGQRTKQYLPTILILGECFRDEEPWFQIIRRLGLTCDRDSFLGAMDAAAEAADSRALILIDALNEGEGKKLWNRELPAVLVAISRYRRLGIAVSARTSYEPVVIQEGLVPQRLIRLVHHGFAEHEYQATRTFFEYYGIQHPNVPLLAPEFENPLFLKLFCKGLQNKGLTTIPKGLRGIKKLFDFFLESVNDRLSRPEQLNFDRRDRVIQKAVHRLADLMAEQGKTRILREEARPLVNSFLGPGGFEGSLFQRLIDEGVIAEDRLPLGPGEWREVVYFSYERFTDHMVVGALLDRHLSVADPSSSFGGETPLGKLVVDEHACWTNRGLIDALSVQIPERLGKELVDVVPHCAHFRPIIEAFVQSIVWRDPKSLLVVTNPEDGSRWITLEGWYFWEQPSSPEEERFENRRRRIWNLLRCYLTRRKDIQTLFGWAKEQDFMGRWMPENHELWRVFLGEFPWAPAFRFHDRPYYSHEGWTQGSGKLIPAPVLSCADGYLGESSTRDCSVLDPIHIALPPRFIVEGMGLRWSGVEGHFFDGDGRLVAFDPSVQDVGPKTLLIREDAFVDFLDKADCDLFWMFLGEKQMIGGRMSRTDWKGRLEVSGAFRRSAGGVEGQINTNYRSAS